MNEILKNTDTVAREIGELYRKYGYSRYKMSKFEEYDTYVRNKDFLISDKVITFTDTNGKLLAMKPDVTLSIIKNTDDCENGVEKVYYTENVYRVSAGAHAFKEIMQTGLECIGDVDSYSICEVVMLAAKSLAVVSDDYILDVSHMGLVSGILDEAGFSGSEKNQALSAIGEKNLPGLNTLCQNKGLSSELTEKVCSLINIYGKAEAVIEKLRQANLSGKSYEAFLELEVLCRVLAENGMADKVQIDFSVVNDMNYYNKIVFRGYIEGIPSGVLSGGQYDKLMAKMGKKSGAIGFAVYLDQLEMLFKTHKEYDVDVAVFYDDTVNPEKVFSAISSLVKEGKTAMAIKNTTDKIRYREKISLI